MLTITQIFSTRFRPLGILLLVALALGGCAPHATVPQQEPTGAKRQLPGPASGAQPEAPGARREGLPVEQQSPPPAQEESSVPPLKSQKGPAHTLYDEAGMALGDDDAHKAELLLERALRIEPRNGWYWYAMGRAKYALGAYEQAIQFCLKSDSLAGADAELRHADHVLLHVVRSRIGASAR